MKKLGLIVAMVVGMYSLSNAQIDANAIGLRLGGGGFGSSAELSYQHSLGGKNRLEFDLGGYSRKDYGGFGLAVMYHWGWNIVEDLHWYVGPGAGIALFNNRKDKNSYTALSVGGQIGLEYDFRTLGAPLQLSLDFRPMWSIFGNSYGHGWGSALGIRYLF